MWIVRNCFCIFLCLVYRSQAETFLSLPNIILVSFRALTILPYTKDLKCFCCRFFSFCNFIYILMLFLFVFRIAGVFLFCVSSCYFMSMFESENGWNFFHLKKIQNTKLERIGNLYVGVVLCHLFCQQSFEPFLVSFILSTSHVCYIIQIERKKLHLKIAMERVNDACILLSRRQFSIFFNCL